MSIEELDTLLNAIKEKSETHPNLSRMWSEYLNLKKLKFEKDIIQAKQALEHMETIDDPSWESIILLTSICEILRENTT